LADRIVKVSLTAQVSNYVSGMEQARRANEKTGTSAADLQAKLEQQNQAMTQMGVGLLAIGALAAAGVGLAVKKFAEFDSAMSEVQASTHESTANMGLLRDAAIEAGALTVFSASEAANAINELAKAGLSTADILGGALDGALSLASAGGLGVAEAAATAATALTLFKLKGEDIPHVADLLAAGAGKAQGSVEDLSQALNQGGLVASQAGFTIEQTTGVLAAFASAGLKGSDAGTSLKTAIIALQKPSTQAQGVMDQYGISVYDSSGKMLSFSGIANQLTTKLGKLTDEQRNSALATIFGTDAVRSAAVLYSNGAKGVEEWNAKVNDTGYAAETARLKLDNLNGDLEQLGGSFDTALIKTGSAANDVLRGMVQNITGLVNAFGEAPPIVQQATLAIGVLAAVTALAGGAFLVGVPKIAQFTTSLATLKDSTMPGVAAGATRIEKTVGRAGAAFGLISKAVPIIVAVGIALQLANTYADSFRASTAELEATVKGGGSALDLFSSQLKGTFVTNPAGDIDLARKQIKNLNASLKEAGEASKVWGQGVSTGTGLALDTLGKVGKTLASTADSDLPAAQKGFRGLAAETDGSRQRLHELLSEMPDYRDSLISVARANGDYSDKMSDSQKKTVLLKLAMGETEAPALRAADAYLAVADAASAAEGDLVKLIDTINKANGVGQDASSANIAYQKTLDDVDAQIQKIKDGTEGYAKTLDITTAAGRDNRALLDDLAKSNQDAATAQFNLDGNTDAFKKTLEAGRQAVIDRAIDLGATADQAQALADNIAKIPTDIAIKALLDASQPNAELDALRAKFRDVGGLIMTLPALQALAVPQKDNPYKKAGGGTVFGPGTSKSDSVPHMLSVGEEVIQEPYASMYRQQLKQMNNGTYAGAAPIQYAASSGYSRSSSAGSAGRGDINAPITINQVTDPNGTATAVVRRMKALGI
jgi:TP901 family phage tail tape measure protein